MSKRRVTVTLDDKLLAAAQSAVSSGSTESVSAFVNEAVSARLLRDQQVAALASLIEEHELEYGIISDEELAEQAQADRDAAASVRSHQRRAG